MKIEESNVRKLNISGIKHLDPISVFLEDFEPSKGKITISCYNKSWHSYWGGMGDRGISEFFLYCDNGYLAKNLSSIKSKITDYDAIGEKIKNYYGDDIEYDLNEVLEYIGTDDEWHSWVSNNYETMREVFGEDWYYDIPTKDNPEYNYLCRIINTVKDALNEL